MIAEHAIAGLILAANAALIGLVLVQGASGAFDPYTPEPFQTLKEQINQEHRRFKQPSQGSDRPGTWTPQATAAPEFILAGMEGFDGEACAVLSDFLDYMDARILEAGGSLPPVDRELMLTRTTCAIEHPMVNLSLRKYRSAWVAVGLRPLTPFRFLAKR